MLSYSFYQVLHLFGAFVLFSALGGMCALALSNEAGERARRLLGIAHGVALLLVLVAGFGQLARLGEYWPVPLWAWLKLGIWVVLGGAVTVVRRRPDLAGLLLWLLPLLGALAGYLAIYRVGGGG